MRLLLAEDEKALSKALVTILERNNYSVDAVYDGEEALDYLETGNYDGVIMDIMMPKMDGIEALKALRAGGDLVPVLMLTAKSEIDDKITGLDSGADDYLVKPFGMMEMISRVRAVLRRARPERSRSALSLGGVTIDPESRRVTANGQEVALTLKEFELLYTLMSSPGVVFTRDRLLSEIWGTDYDGETRTVDVHVRTLRQKLGEAGSVICTVRGVGYRTEA